MGETLRALLKRDYSAAVPGSRRFSLSAMSSLPSFPSTTP
jgi:hypothetical protein